MNIAQGLKIKRSYLWAAGFALLIGVWLLSGLIAGNGGGSDKKAAAPAAKAFQVRAERLVAGTRHAQIIVRGRTDAVRRIEARAQTAGLVDIVPYKEGTRVNKGDLLCALEQSTRPARLAEARAKLAQAELELNAASELERQKFASRTQRATEKAKFDAARAAVAAMEKEIEYTKILANERGIIEKRGAEPGSFLQIGGLCATVAVLDPMRVIGMVSERDVAHIREGMDGTARLITGETANGTIQFVSPSAETETRTFRIELEVPNPDYRLRSGVTAEIRVPLPAERAHLIAPSALALDDQGRIGVKLIDKDGKVHFTPVKILADGTDGVWIAGVPEKITLITIGHEYVVHGQKVEPVFANKAPAS